MDELQSKKISVCVVFQFIFKIGNIRYRYRSIFVIVIFYLVPFLGKRMNNLKLKNDVHTAVEFLLLSLCSTSISGTQVQALALSFNPKQRMSNDKNQ